MGLGWGSQHARPACSFCATHEPTVAQKRRSSAADAVLRCDCCRASRALARAWKIKELGLGLGLGLGLALA